MPTPTELRELTSDQRDELEDCADRLEQSLQKALRPVNLADFLPAADQPHRRAVLLELIKVELEGLHRHKRGLTLEEYVKRYPELGTVAELPPSLVYEEYRVRRLYSDQPSLDTYRDRFPRQFEKVRSMVSAIPMPGSFYILTPPPVVPVLPPGTDEVEIDDIEDQTPTQAGGRTAGMRRGTDAQQRSNDAIAGLLPLTGYEKKTRLGGGEFGEVWSALAPGGVEVAIKQVMRNLDDESTRRELKALEKVCRLHHPFLLPTHSFGIFEGRLTIVMERADGSLTDRIKRCRAQGLDGIPVTELVTYFGQAAEALDYLQTQQVTHRDIKPENLLMLRGYAKVADFGMARAQERTLDAASVVCGTPYYMAPEVWQQQIHRHSDQYSLAATYVEMRLGRHLFTGKTPYEIAEKHMRADPDLTGLPAAEQKVLLRALSKDPEKRFPTCVEFAEALKAATPPQSTAARRRLVAMIAALGVAVTAAVTVAWIVYFRS